MDGESSRMWGFHGTESVALPFTYSLFGVFPHASMNAGENLMSAGLQPLAIQRDIGVFTRGVSQHL